MREDTIREEKMRGDVHNEFKKEAKDRQEKTRIRIYVLTHNNITG